jgi:hypothetical protein
MNTNINKLDTFSKVLILCIVMIALLNAYLHNPYVGYDADDYAAYIRTIATGQLPEMGENDEFFTPPLPFLLPALFEVFFHPPELVLLKIAQYINVLVAFGSIAILARISNLISGGDDRSRNLTLLFILSLPVFYKTHAFVRAEPYLLFFILLYVEQLILISNGTISVSRFSVSSGLIFGAIMLSRQWGILIVPGILLYAGLLVLRQRERRLTLLMGFCISGIIAFLMSAWFYFSLQTRYGSMTAFNREPVEQLSLKNKPASFYIGTGNKKLFIDPVRDSFDRQIIPILYSETWGDYWGYFLVTAKDIRSGNPIQGGLLQLALEENDWSSSIETNRYTINNYLALVNIVALLPTLIALISVSWGVIHILRTLCIQNLDLETLYVTLFILMIFSTLLGYLWFLIQYPTNDGDTIKATYILQIYPFIALLVGQLGKRIFSYWRWMYSCLLGIYLLTLILIQGALITRAT